MDKRPTVFIGSSSEGLPVANALAKRFGDKAIVDVWDAGNVFRSMESYLDSLLIASSLYEFAILVFTSDDQTTSRDETHATARDNILFEFGLFLGRVGRRRTFGLVLDKLHVPSDLQGIHFDKFKRRADGRPVAAFTTLADRIVGQVLERHATQAEFTQLPSTALAIGYYENFVARICDQLDNYQPLVIKEAGGAREIDYKSFTLNIVIPDDLKLVEHAALRSLIKGLTQVVISNSDTKKPGALRDFPFYIQALPEPGSTHLELFDVPTTMKSARRAVQKIFPTSNLGKDNSQAVAELREINNFERTLRMLVSDNPVWEQSIKYRYLTEFVPKNGV